MNAPDPNLVASVRARLENQTRSSGQNFEDILYRYAIERFLYRLSQSHYRDQFVLKGAQVVAAWGVAFRFSEEATERSRGASGFSASNQPAANIPVATYVCRR